MAKPVKSNLDFEGQSRIQNLPEPSADQEAATKYYVDNNGGGASMTNIIREQSATFSYFAGDLTGGINYKALRYDSANNLTTNTDVLANKPTDLSEFEALVYT